MFVCLNNKCKLCKQIQTPVCIHGEYSLGIHEKQSDINDIHHFQNRKLVDAHWHI